MRKLLFVTFFVFCELNTVLTSSLFSPEFHDLQTRKGKTIVNLSISHMETSLLMKALAWNFQVYYHLAILSKREWQNLQINDCERFARQITTSSYQIMDTFNVIYCLHGIWYAACWNHPGAALNFIHKPKLAIIIKQFYSRGICFCSSPLPNLGLTIENGPLIKVFSRDRLLWVDPSWSTLCVVIRAKTQPGSSNYERRRSH